MTSGTTHDQHPGTGHRLRASDAERMATVDLLKDAVAAGLLSPDEGSERMATAFAARYRDELPAVTADLPAQAPPAPAAAAGWRALAAALVAQLRQEVASTRAAGVRSRRALVTAVVAVVLVAVLVSLVVHGLWDGGPGDGFRGDRR
ncbi:DUF1707 SHOCT-like domain-containing protein [Modestobacter altitudinis]|uniref:DUF1707 SHOCT-like domain-containing protein n=1 Tax=Modestobacter altitudinis TaxID=2213158 RepID=UPI00110CBA9A|nr:DUF1707 domain-containing protein [Modestobacter altitudinis]